MGLRDDTIRLEIVEERRLLIDAKIEVEVKSYDEVYEQLKDKTAVEVEAWFMDEIGREVAIV